MEILDALDIAELTSFAVLAGTRKGAKQLIPDKRKGYTKIALNLSCYAWNKVTAMRCRLEGRIDAALQYEGIADRIYKRLPQDIKW